MDHSRPSTALRVATGLLALAGLAMMAYLTQVHFAPVGSASFCDFAPGFSCEVVNKSAFSEILGMPVALLGLGYFGAMLAVAMLWERLDLRRWALAFTAFSLAFGLYLSWVELALLGSVCLFCELSKLAMAGLAVVLGVSVRKEAQAVPWRLIALGIAGGAALSAVAFFSRL